MNYRDADLSVYFNKYFSQWPVLNEAGLSVGMQPNAVKRNLKTKFYATHIELCNVTPRNSISVELVEF